MSESIPDTVKGKKSPQDVPTKQMINGSSPRQSLWILTVLSMMSCVFALDRIC
ncbi:hypothetical protein BDN70DRAFT_877539 [Pholiota conissans]|uniref:Uncharacterized protein n=1 Tax=Pholiota conissans TaxID=109636 RepID=A0A9P5Z3N8_9AGAR|nr:hypothetical protein BDN70DRAFT_877539 [Pholiota conissans]